MANPNWACASSKRHRFALLVDDAIARRVASSVDRHIALSLIPMLLRMLTTVVPAHWATKRNRRNTVRCLSETRPSPGRKLDEKRPKLVRPCPNHVQKVSDGYPIS